MLNRLIGAILKAFLVILDKVFILTRKRVTPLYPYDKKTKTVILPKEVEKEILRIISSGNKAEAIKQITRLMGAGLRTSKDYVDRLDKQRKSAQVF
ncbi:MAG TPA: hypothetical protein VHT73_01985 [Thermodesulfobacteriota bacterium]|nr:hypothetical protein [Thermodesulfobacteriota bacterium]